MISFSMTETQFNTVVIPTTGKTRRGKDVALEGPVVIAIDNPQEGFATVTIDPEDPSGFTVRVSSTITEQTPGDGPWLITGSLSVDGRVGPEVKHVTVPFAVELTPSLDAASFTATVGAAKDLPTPPPSGGPTAARR